MSERRTKLYPVYLVHELDSLELAEPVTRFRIADMLFRKPKLVLDPSDQRLDFRMATTGKRFKLELSWERVRPGQDGEMTLLFDPDFSRRKRKNAIQFRVREDGTLHYDEYRYEIETHPIPEEVEWSCKVAGDMLHLHLSLPFSLLRLDSRDSPIPQRRVMGFNLIRTIISDGEKQVLTWSGIKGDKTDVGQGTGMLLLTRGLSPDVYERQAEDLSRDADHYFMEWKRRKVPEELYGFLTPKKRGLTVRLNEEDIRLARRNAEQTDWGRRTQEAILRIADYWAAKSDDELFELVPFGNPRAMSVGQSFGDPLTGGLRTAFQVCLERPYHYYHPTTGVWWHNGMTLQNPSTGEELVLEDDGRGFLAPEGFPNPGVRYMFTASYRNFLLAMLMAHPYCEVLEDRNVLPETSGDAYAGAIPNLAYAYQLTGDPKYAYKALLLAGRIAELAPYMNGNYGNAYCDTVLMSEPSTTESHWLSNYFDALDLVYDAIGDVEPQLAAFFAGKPDAENKPRSKPFSIVETIYDFIPQVLFSCEVERTRDADWSMRWLHVELLVASFMGSGKLMRHLLYEGKHSLVSRMRNSFFRDGRYSYDSLFYIDHICEQMCFMANNNYRFRDDEIFPDGLDLFEDGSFGLRQLIGLYVRLRCGHLLPMFGDNGFVDNAEPISEERRKGKMTYSPAFEVIYRRMPSSRSIVGQVLAQYDREELERYRVETVQWKNKRTLLAKQKHALLLLACAPDWQEYQDLYRREGAIQPSFLLQDSETSFFRTGTDARNTKHVVLYGQPSAGHRHGDKLGLWIGAYGYHLLAGAGGYPSSWVSPKWQAWEVHAAACAVVVVDGKDQEISYSRLREHYEGQRLQGAGMSNTTAVPGTAAERWCWVVQAPNGADAYVLDLNSLQGGGTFDYNVPALDLAFEQIAFEGLPEAKWRLMQGTLAGEDVPLYSRPGYGWMQAVRRAPVEGQVSWTMDYGRAGLKVHALPPEGGERELVCSLGERGGREMGKSRWEPFVMWRDTASDGRTEEHQTLFVSVLEPFENRPFIREVRPLIRVDPAGADSAESLPDIAVAAGIEVLYADGHRDILISVLTGDTVAYRDAAGRLYRTDARALLLRYRGETLLELEGIRCSQLTAGAYSMRHPHAVYRGIVQAADLETGEIRIELEEDYPDFPEELQGRVALIDSPDYLKPSAYYLFDPSRQGRQFTFRTDMTLIKLEPDWPAPHKRNGLGEKRTVEHHGKTVYVDVKPGDSFELSHAFRQVIASR